MAENALRSLKATQIDEATLLNHLRLDPEYTSDADRLFACQAHQAACMYVAEACGIDGEELDKWPDLAIATLVLTRDMYDNRTLSQEYGLQNPTVQSILSLHDFNLLGPGDQE